MSTQSERESAIHRLAEAIGPDTYDCMRVWGAWFHGSMCRDDFIPVINDEDRLNEITEAVIAPLLSRIAELETMLEQERKLRQESECMGLTMSMVMDDFEQAGIIKKGTAPMFFTEAVLAHIQGLSGDAEPVAWCRAGIASTYDGLPWDCVETEFTTEKHHHGTGWVELFAKPQQ
ncbi:hypothetical protein SAMN05192560_2101 [Methylobacillus rhizosphaerae]|uniref:Uncharacterized protein n=1 Tax=Methylobacillus rhizosphaerae TaxID=551994 RepID=A0A239ATD6_9PROT|nr:hypothetical protein [Methylobacillus rhizosphaerae]SNR98887.1 hypothetical protein SAMN05192560_2101 [Methylobacillus rhizosphaerae]